jgi:putative nucleotidyltransferase with HDIG domain
MNLTLLLSCKRAPIPRRGDPAVRALLDLIGGRDPSLRRHSEAVARISVAVAEALELPPHRGDRLRSAALLHDVGKLAVPSAVIQKPAPLTADEYAVVRRHPVWGFHIVDAIGLTREARWVLHHHERPDGEGYPDGLRAGEIAAEASILHVADAFDALTADRPYRSALSYEAALATIADGAGTEFDPACVAALEAVSDPTPAGPIHACNG